MYSDFVANKRSRLDTKSVWQGNFSQWLIELAMKDVSQCLNVKIKK